MGLLGIVVYFDFGFYLLVKIKLNLCGNYSIILLNWLLLFFIGFRESSISLLSNETDAGGS